MTTTWCILRTAPSRTVPLVKALAAAGFEVWTPQETSSRRAARSRIEKEVVVPITPSIAFAEYERLPELVMLSRMQSPRTKTWDDAARAWISKPVPPFSVFRFLDAYPRVADRDLDALRVAEQRVRPKGKVRTFAPGETVKLIGGGFEGLVGTVQGMRGQHTLVTFGDWDIPVAIAAVNLLPVPGANVE
jgi:transcription antitermination factor NusG